MLDLNKPLWQLKRGACSATSKSTKMKHKEKIENHIFGKPDVITQSNFKAINEICFFGWIAPFAPPITEAMVAVFKIKYKK